MKRVTVVFALLVSGCHLLQRYDYVPLESYRYRPASLQRGRPLRLLAFSGRGRKATKDEVFYYQFIVETASGRQMRVLAPAILFRMEDGTYTYTDPGQIEKDKTPLTCSFQPIDSTTNLMLQGEQLAEMASSQNLDPDKLQQLRSGISLRQLVLVPQARPDLFQNPNLPTVKGVLQFEEKPW